MPDSNLARLLAFARRLQPAHSLAELLLIARDETRSVVGYDRVWFMVADDDNPNLLRLLEFSGHESSVVWDVAATLNVEEDAFVRAVLHSDEPVVVEDARTDPRTDKRIVEYLQNRTLIKIPIRVVDKPWGLIGMGTFGDEGCRAPTAEQLSYLVGMVGQLAVAISRIRFVEAEQRAAVVRLELERRLQRIHRLESLGTLAGGIAHDFNNLLTVITASASLIESDDSDPEDVRENIRSVLQAADRGTSLTRQLLAMSRSQALDVRALDLNSQLSQLVELVRRLVPASIETRLIFADGMPPVDGDAGQLDQVFMNLVLNARDAMPDGGQLTIETKAQALDEEYVELHPWAKPGEYVVVTVTDTGIGMSKAVLDRAFEPFFTTKDARMGTGLGLAVAYGIVQQHRGLLNVYSEPGQGTTFNVYLRVASGARQARPIQPERGPAPAARGDEHLLLADDDELVRRVGERILTRAGYRVTLAVNGESLCEAAQREHFELAIVDVVMPGLGCDALLDRLTVVAPELRVLLASGYAAGLNILALTEKTGSELLRKPYAPAQLLRAVRDVIDRPREPGPDS